MPTTTSQHAAPLSTKQPKQAVQVTYFQLNNRLFKSAADAGAYTAQQALVDELSDLITEYDLSEHLSCFESNLEHTLDTKIISAQLKEVTALLDKSIPDVHKLIIGRINYDDDDYDNDDDILPSKQSSRRRR